MHTDTPRDKHIREAKMSEIVRCALWLGHTQKLWRCDRAGRNRFKKNKGLRDRNNPTCTLSPNAYSGSHHGHQVARHAGRIGINIQDTLIAQWLEQYFYEQ